MNFKYYFKLSLINNRLFCSDLCPNINIKNHTLFYSNSNIFLDKNMLVFINK